ncbi:MAG: HepT-like ribonuclease domain-containing protein [Bacteroidota bacterium]
MRDKEIGSKERIEHILKAISDIESFIENQTKESFLENYMAINATLFQLAIIGEAIVQVDDDILKRYSYPWHKVRGFRNFILHEYHAIEFRIVWYAAKNDLTELKKVVKKILENEF